MILLILLMIEFDLFEYLIYFGIGLFHEMKFKIAP